MISGNIEFIYGSDGTGQVIFDDHERDEHRPHDDVMVPLEKTYQAAWETVPTRWQRVVEPGRES